MKNLFLILILILTALFTFNCTIQPAQSLESQTAADLKLKMKTLSNQLKVEKFEKKRKHIDAELKLVSAVYILHSSQRIRIG